MDIEDPPSTYAAGQLADQAVERLHRLGGAHVADAKVQHVRAFSVVEVGHEAAMRRRRRAAGGGVFRLWRKLGLQAHERVDPGM
eukprot:CAMPEP_0182847776 /NCGR_PEP_ID=MMETSP0006_2-20121128/28641_1 /TAXON_ID=97485 /ORGANISM="Prymnesium parvum, Strain Texoma1" /LENGTH=83 /DNA_ID=CAMNT_0024978137 /DNA_START=554 /DNA_END=805 /DNA_ORIENTATION=-